MASLTNEEIFKKLHDLGVKIGPVTDSTRNLYLKKLEQLQNVQKSDVVKTVSETYSDDRLRAAFKIYNVDIGPITSDSVRKIYLKRLETLEKQHGGLLESEPMDIVNNYEEVEDDL